MQESISSLAKVLIFFFETTKLEICIGKESKIYNFIAYLAVLSDQFLLVLHD